MILGEDHKPPLDELAHHGIKGMHWGVRHDPKPSGNRASRRAETKSSGGRGSSGTTLSARDKAVLKAAGVSVDASAHLQSKYGPGTLGPEPKPHRLTPQQKKLIGGVVVAAGVAGAAYYLHQQGAFGGLTAKIAEHKSPITPEEVARFKAVHPAVDHIPAPRPKTWQDIPSFMKEYQQYQVSAATRQNGYTADVVKNLDTKSIHIPAGTIFKRVSTEKETEINPFGFFASHEAEDVDRYKAILPVFWKQWGLGRNSGYVVNLKAATDIKAPSHRETYDIFKGMLHDELDGKDFGMPGKVKVKDLFLVSGQNDDEIAQKAFPQAAQLWNTNAHPLTKKFVAKVKEKGYNALPDLNDAGSLSKNPMRLLDGSLFSIVGHEELSADAIRTAQENIQALAHYALLINQGGGRLMFVDENPDASLDDVLEHFGVKGMKWGVRHDDHPGASRATNKQARKDATEFARAKMFYGDGAGTRRKLIKAKVESASKKDPTYKAAFDHHLANQDLGVHAEKAQGERRRKNTAASVGKTARGINRAVQGPFGSTIAVTAIVAGVGYMKTSGLDKKVAKAGRDFINQQKFGTKVDLSFLNN